MNAKRQALVIGAHHDDNELVAGTLARLKARGWRLTSVVMTNGIWIRGKASEKHIAIRERESLAAATLLGMQTVFLRLPEGEFHNTHEARRAVVEQMRRIRPNLVITHPPRDYHLDHMETSRCVHDATMMCWNACVRTASPPCPPPALYYSDAWFTPFEPDEYVDISEEIKLKCRMLRCHKSQLPPPRSKDESMVDLAQLQSRVRGVEADVRYAEAFRRQPFPGSVRMAGLLS